MTATATGRERLDIGRVIGGTLAALRRNWWRILVLVLPLTAAPYLAAFWIDTRLPRLHLGLVTPLVENLVWTWVTFAVDLVPGSMMSIYFCRWAIADMEGGRKSFSLGDPRRLGDLVLAKAVADVAVGLAGLFLYLPAIFLSMVWAPLAPVVVLEGARPLQGLGRSAALTKSHRIRLLLVVAIFYAAYFALRIGVNLAVGSFRSTLTPQQALESLALLGYLSAALPATIWALVWHAFAPVLYFELIRLKNGIGGPDSAAVFD